MRIVQLANFVAPRSGGIRTVLGALGRGYLEAGHERILVIPGRRYGRRRLPHGGEQITLAGRSMPGSGGYRLLPKRSEVEAVLDRLRPDAVEVSDRFTLGWTAAWARRAGVGHLVIVHERLDHVLRSHLATAPTGPVRRIDARLAERAGQVVVPSEFAALAFPDRTAHVVRWGVDLDRFRPRPGRREPSGNVRLVLVSRLSREKRPELALDAVGVLLARGFRVHLDVVGDGPRAHALRRRAVADRLPVTFHGHLDRPAVAAELAAADVALAPCGAETFGLAALEALACGTAVVVPMSGALPELLGVPAATPATTPAGAAAASQPMAFAFAVQRLLAIPTDVRRAAARELASAYTWTRSVEDLLRLHRSASDAAPGKTLTSPGARSAA